MMMAGCKLSDPRSFSGTCAFEDFGHGLGYIKQLDYG